MPRQRLQGFGLQGLNTDTLPTMLPEGALTLAKNIEPEGGGVRSVFGEYKLFNVPLKPFYHTAFIDYSGDQKMAISDSFSAMIVDMATGVSTNITPDTGTWGGGYVTFSYLQGLLVVNSSSDGAFFWDQTGTGKLELLPGWTHTGDNRWRCKQIVAYRNYLVAVGLGIWSTTYNAYDYWTHRIAWSSGFGDPGIPSWTWTPALDNDAGDDTLGETPGFIMGAVPIRDALWVIKEDSIFECKWIGGDYVMRTRMIHPDLGTKMLRGFVEMKGNLIVFNSKDVVVFDGHNTRSIVDQRIRKKLFDDVNGPYWFLCQLHVHAPSSQLFLSVASKGQDIAPVRSNVLQKCYVYNWDTNVWTERDLRRSYGFDNALLTLDQPVVAGGFQATVTNPGEEWNGASLPWNSDTDPWDPPGSSPGNPQPPGGDPGDGSWSKGMIDPSVTSVIVWESDPSDGSWWASALVNSNTYSDGSRKFCAIEKIGIPIEGSPGKVMMTRAWFELQGTAEVRIVFGSQESPNGVINWGNNDVAHQVLVTDSSNEIEVTPRVTGRFICFHLESSSTGWWRLGGITFHWESAGER